MKADRLNWVETSTSKRMDQYSLHVDISWILKSSLYNVRPTWLIFTTEIPRIVEDIYDVSNEIYDVSKALSSLV